MDEEAVAAAYQQHGAAVMRRCRALLRDEQVALELTQEVFVRCLRQRRGLRAGRELLGWLYRVATNLCLTALRKNRIRRTAPLDEVSGWLAAPEVGTRRGVEDMLRGLDPRTQAIVVYVYLDGMTQAEAAEVARVSERTVRTCLARFVKQGRAGLALALEEELP
jgi:RNA polymerase sigma-70 factor (ECF subfamily)